MISSEFEQAIFDLFRGLKTCDDCIICPKHLKTVVKFSRAEEP